jgi:hypothetical protein
LAQGRETELILNWIPFPAPTNKLVRKGRYVTFFGRAGEQQSDNQNVIWGIILRFSAGGANHPDHCE